MIYFTQLIFIKEGKELAFQAFEDFAIPLMEQYNGRIIQRIRPDASSFISGDTKKPYEIHFLSFDSDADFKAFSKDETRKDFLHLKEEAVESTLLVKGYKV